MVVLGAMAATCLVVARLAGDIATETPTVVTPRVAWPPDMRVAPPPPDALPPETWPTLRVAVLDAVGAPVAGAAVQVWVDGRGCIGRSYGSSMRMRPDVVDSPRGTDTWLSGAAFTGADGVATIRVPTGTATHVVARDAAGRVAVAREDVYDSCMMPCAGQSCGFCADAPCTYRRAPSCSGERTRVMRVHHPGVISGRVVDHNRRPLAGAHVLAVQVKDFEQTADPWSDSAHWILDEWSRVATGPPHLAPVQTDSTGAFAFQVARPEPLLVVAAAPGQPLASVRVDPAEPRRFIELRTGPPSRLALRVVDGAGQPVEATVYVGDDGKLFQTDAAGRALLSGLSARRETFWVTADGFESRELVLAPDQSEVLVRLSPRRHVAVEVTAPRALVSSLGDRPLVEVELVPSDGRPLTPSYPDKRRGAAELAPDGHGRAFLNEVLPGMYRVRVTWRGGLVRGPEVLVPAAGIASATVHLAGDATLSGFRPGGNRRDLIVPPERRH